MKNPTILIDVNSEGNIDVYWHDPEESGRVAPDISVAYGEDRYSTPVSWDEATRKRHKELVDDHDAMIQDQFTQQIF